LTSRHAACQFCQAAGGGVTAQNFAPAGAGSSPAAAPQRESARARKRRRNLGVSTIVAFLLVGAVGLLLYTYGMDFMRMPELTDIPMVQFQPPTPDVTDTPWPSPTPTDAPTATETPIPAAEDALVEAPTDAQIAPGGDVIQISDDAAAAEATVTATFTPVFEDEELTIRPRAGEAGWWASEDNRRNHLGDSFLYAGQFEGQTYISAARFDLSRVARGAPIRNATLRLTGLREDRFNPNVDASWTVQLLAQSSLEEMAQADFLTAYSAPASITFAPLPPNELGVKTTNEWALDNNALRWLEQQLLDGATAVTVRILPNVADADSLFAWDSGQGPETENNPPELSLTVGPPPPTPPPLPTKPFIVATLTPVPENILTVVAMAGTATTVAEAVGTYTPLPYEVYTPTPTPENLETVQANAVAEGLPPVILYTPTPENEATAAAHAEYATAVALTTGTFTPTPEAYVTPVLVVPSPPAENVATAAARVVAATAAAGEPGYSTPTPLPYNAVFGQFVYATTAAENRETAIAMVAEAEARAQVDGTPTPLPWNAVVITKVPPPPPTPIPLVISSANFTPTPTATALPPDVLPDFLRNKIVFKSNRSGKEDTYIMDPATGDVSLITQNWVHPLAREQLGLAPDGLKETFVRKDNRGIHQIHVRFYEYNSDRQVTGMSKMAYDPAWSPRGDRIAFVSLESGNDEIYLVDEEGNNLVQLTRNEWEWDKHPAWSPDGSQIVFFSNRETGRRQIWVMNADGSNPRNMSNNEYEDWDPVWTR
jgi:hypothetical protein